MATITDINQLDPNGIYTYADYLMWKFEERIELLKGRIFKMSPAPSTNHQRVFRKLFSKIDRFLEPCKCELFSAPFDVRLPNKGKNDEQIYTVVQPDICIICDPHKLDDRGCIGAPDLVVEILSPGNSKKEMKNKFDLYEEAGIAEYWVVFPAEETVLVNVLDNGKYRTLRPVSDDIIISERFPDLRIHTSTIFR